VRYPLVPGCNDKEADILSLASHVKALRQVAKIEIIPYHRYGELKYEMLDREYPLSGLAIPDPEKVDWACDLVRSRGLGCEAVR
ncbi:MAG: pyruvate formate-lyase 1-activating enzyme, partial [Dehalococcoidia bacterium]|nr:pyruvate formate-lyase 1-activating enzyme [Dehalococcoidia bacterium]